MGLEDARELAHLPPHERARFVFEAESSARREPLLRSLRVLTWIAGVGAAAAWAAFPFLAHADARAALFLPVGLTFLGAAAAVVRAFHGIKVRRLHLRDVLLLEDLRPAACFACGRSLRQADAARCPGCGAQLLRRSQAP